MLTGPSPAEQDAITFLDHRGWYVGAVDAPQPAVGTHWWRAAAYRRSETDPATPAPRRGTTREAAIVALAMMLGGPEWRANL